VFWLFVVLPEDYGKIIPTLPPILYLLFVLMALVIYYWRLQLDNSNTQITTLEWEISMIIFITLLKQKTKQYLKQSSNTTYEPKNKNNKNKWLWLEYTIYIINYILVSVFGLYDTFTDHHPVFAWGLFSGYLLFCILIIYTNGYL
jgi:hypothetical protein